MSDLILADVLHRLVNIAPINEDEKFRLNDVIADHFSDEIEGLDDDTKSTRAAAVDRTAGMTPSIAAGGISQAQLNAAVAQAVREYAASERAKEQGVQDSQKTVQAPMTAAPAVAPQQGTATEPAALPAAAPAVAPNPQGQQPTQAAPQAVDYGIPAAPAKPAEPPQGS